MKQASQSFLIHQVQLIKQDGILGLWNSDGKKAKDLKALMIGLTSKVTEIHQMLNLEFQSQVQI